MVTGIPWSEILPAAIAVAISPVPISAVILALFSRRPRSNGVVFLLGWMVGLIIIEMLVAPLAGRIDAVPKLFDLHTGAVLRLGIGLFFLTMALIQWLRRPKSDEVRQLPAWTARLEKFKPWQTVLVSLGLCIVNPKNLTLVLAVLLALGDARTSAWQTLVAIVVFVLLGSTTVAVPVCYRLFAGAGADAQLGAWKRWLLANSATVMVVVFVLMGAFLVGKGLEGLL